MGSYQRGRVLGWHQDPTCLPARTPGPLGINDHADPNVTAFVGDTPGPLGVNDCADPSLESHLLRSSLDRPHNFPISYSLFDSHQSSPVTTGSLDLEQAQTMALQITVHFEGGGYAALADNFDKQGMSYGLVQWNFGQDTLGPLLKKMMEADPTAFETSFGSDTNYGELASAIRSGNKREQMKWASSVIKEHRWGWKKAFQHLASVETFRKIQREEAIKNYHPLASTAANQLRKISPNLFRVILFRSYAVLFDLCVQQHGISNALRDIEKGIRIKRPADQLEALKIVITERAYKANRLYQSDCISRRMGILTGKPFHCTQQGLPVERKNPHFCLIDGHGDKHVLHV